MPLWFSKLPFRTLVRKHSCALCYTAPIVATDFARSVKARDGECTTNQGDCPLIVQFAAKDARLLPDAALVVRPYANGDCGCGQWRTLWSLLNEISWRSPSMWWNKWKILDFPFQLKQGSMMT